MSLKQNDKKIKVLGTGLLIGAGLLLISLIWQLYALDGQYNQVQREFLIEKALVFEISPAQQGSQGSSDFYIAASKSGTKYYYPNCAGLKRIKPENLTYFASESQAEGAGYTLAKNCQKPQK